MNQARISATVSHAPRVGVAFGLKSKKQPLI